MKSINQLMAASLIAMGAIGAIGATGGLALAQAQDKPSAVKDESKMDPKGVPGSPSTQGGKEPAATSGSSSGDSSSASKPGEEKAATTSDEVTMSRDASKMDSKGIPGSTSTQSGKTPESK